MERITRKITRFIGWYGWEYNGVVSKEILALDVKKSLHEIPKEEPSVIRHKVFLVFSV